MSKQQAEEYKRCSVAEGKLEQVLKLLQEIAFSKPEDRDLMVAKAYKLYRKTTSNY